MAIVNVATDGNYMFPCEKPEDLSIIVFLGPWPWYILTLEGVFLVICLILYFPFALTQIKQLQK